jgi:hypothetical protein
VFREFYVFISENIIFLEIKQQDVSDKIYEIATRPDIYLMLKGTNEYNC